MANEDENDLNGTDVAIYSDGEDNQHHKGYQLRYAIELPMFCIMFAVAISGTPVSNLIMYRTCVHSLNHTVKECKSFLAPDKINHSQELEKEVQEYVTLVNTVRSILEALVPAVLSVFIGVWSDKHGRKPLIVWSFFGLTFNAMLVVVYSLMERLGPWWIIGCGLPFSLTGGFNVLIIGVMCFISDVTNKDNRSLRLTMIQLCYATGQTVGGMISPYLLKWVGNVYLLLIVAAIETFGYAFVMVFIEESLTNFEQGSIRSVLKLSHIREMASACFKRKPNYGRAILLLTVGASVLSLFVIYGMNGLLYLYTRNVLDWTMKDFTIFSSISTAMWFVGALVGVAFIQKWLNLSDLTFTAISFLSCVAEFTIKTCARSTWVMYLGSAVSLFGTVSAVLIRSFLSKILPSQDIAKAFGFMSSAESLCPLLAPLMYNALYALTISTFPGSILILTGSIYAVCFVLILIVIYLTRRTSSGTYHIIDES